MTTAIDMTGASIGGVLVISLAGSRAGKVVWNCRCHCGADFQAVGASLRAKKTTRCSVCAKALTVATATKHGLVGTGEYNSYNAMNARCYDPLNKRFERYGGRGIAVCERWRESFSNFIQDMGMKPTPDHSIERNDRDGDYEPTNCVWATKVEQANNRSNNTQIEINGRTQTLTQWARESGVNRTVILRRKQRGITGASLIHKGVAK